MELESRDPHPHPASPITKGTVIDLADKAGRKGNTGQWVDRCPVRTGDVAHPDTRRK